jgi:hypothetical protein
VYTYHYSVNLTRCKKNEQYNGVFTPQRTTHVGGNDSKQCTVIPRFSSLMSSSKTARKAKTRKTKINFPLLPEGNNDRLARGRNAAKTGS